MYFAMILTDKLKQPVVAKFLSVINMGHIHTQALTNTYFVTHIWKCLVECGIHHMPETGKVKMVCDVPHLF